MPINPERSEPILYQVHVARHLGVTARAVRAWQVTGKMPAPDYLVNGRAGWKISTIERHFAMVQPQGQSPCL